MNLCAGLDKDGVYDGSFGGELANVGTYYSLKPDGKYIQRSMHVEVVASDDDIYLPSLKTPLYKSCDQLKDYEGCHKNWANGRYENGPEVIEMVMDLVRKEAESCDALQGFQLAHSIGGGTGAGLGSLIISRLREDYSERIISTFSVFPSPKVSDIPVEPYNAALTAHYLITDVDFCYIFDNETLYEGLLANGFDPKSNLDAKHSALMDNLAPAMAAATCAFRFPAQHTSSLRSVLQDLVPNPRLHFLSSTVVPLARTPYLQQLTDLQKSPFNPYSPSNATVKPRTEHYIACAATYRGSALASQVDDLFSAFKPTVRGYFGESFCSVPAYNLENSVSLVGNHTSAQCVWERISEQYDNLYRRKSFLAWYIGCGMDEMEFVEARDDLYSLIEEYKLSGGRSTDIDTTSI